MHGQLLSQKIKIISAITIIISGIIFSIITKQVQWSMYVLITFVLLVLFSFDFRNPERSGDEKLYTAITDRTSSNCIRGIMAVLIVLSHSHYYMDSIGFLKVFQPFGYLGVSVFFFLSGYGVSINLKNNKKYLLGYWKKRLIKLYLPYVIANVIYLLCIFPINITGNPAPNEIEIIVSFTALKRILPFSWYIIVVFGWYAVYYVVAKLHLSEKRTLLILSIVLLLYYGIGFLSGISSFYYNSTVCLIIGCIAGYFGEKTGSVLNNKYKRCICISIISFMFLVSVLALYKFGAVNNTLYSIIIMLSSALFVLSLYVLGRYIKFQSKALLMLGNISYEIYLLQGPIYIICSHYIQNDMFVFEIVFWSFLLASSVAVNRVSLVLSRKLI